ncbi:MAG: hypothetical protein J6T34_05275 [Bacilli bacterium]|nr:hypothetical protein [Bacilli bacterium]
MSSYLVRNQTSAVFKDVLLATLGSAITQTVSISLQSGLQAGATAGLTGFFAGFAIAAAAAGIKELTN